MIDSIVNGVERAWAIFKSGPVAQLEAAEVEMDRAIAKRDRAGASLRASAHAAVRSKQALALAFGCGLLAGSWRRPRPKPRKEGASRGALYALLPVVARFALRRALKHGFAGLAGEKPS